MQQDDYLKHTVNQETLTEPSSHLMRRRVTGQNLQNRKTEEGGCSQILEKTTEEEKHEKTKHMNWPVHNRKIVL